MNEQPIQNQFKKLPDRNYAKLSLQSRKDSLVCSLPIFIFGMSLVVMVGSNLYHPFFPFAVATVLTPIVLDVLAHRKIDYFTKKYNPVKKARNHLILIGVLIVFLICFLTPFVFIVLKKPLNISTLIIVFLLAVPIYISIKISVIPEYIKTRKNGKRYGTSKIQLLEKPIVLGGSLKIRFENQSSILIGKRLQASLRNISEVMEQNRPSDKSETAVLYQRYEKVTSFVMEEPQKILRFEIPKIDTVPTNIVGLEPDYWELEIREAAGLYFSRFLLEVS